MNDQNFAMQSMMMHMTMMQQQEDMRNLQRMAEIENQKHIDYREMQRQEEEYLRAYDEEEKRKEERRRMYEMEMRRQREEEYYRSLREDEEE